MAKLALSFKGNLLKVVHIAEGEMTIGRDPACDIHIDSLAVQPVHAKLICSNDKIVIKDGGSNDGTFVNHQRVDDIQLNDNDIIRIGKHVLRFIEDNDEVVEKTSGDDVPPAVDTDEPADTDDRRNGWLQILSGKHLGKTVKLKSGMTDLGKHHLPPALVSLRKGQYYISSLGDDEISIANEPIGETSRPLNDGDRLKIGNVELQFYLQ